MAKVIYFLSDADGRWDLSDGDPKIGHIEQAGLGFVVQTTPDSVLARMNGISFASKQQAIAAIEESHQRYLQASHGGIKRDPA
jgi:hypothetical protein